MTTDYTNKLDENQLDASQRQEERARYYLERALNNEPKPIRNKDGSISKKGRKSNNNKLTKKAQQELIAYKEFLEAQLKITTIYGYIDRLSRMCRHTQKALSELKPEDYAEYWKGISDPEKYLIKSGIKRYYERFRDDTETLRRIDLQAPTPSLKTKRKKQSELILVENGRLQKMIRSANSKRDKALIGVLFDTGCRITELLSVRMSDLNFAPRERDKANPLIVTIRKSKTAMGEGRDAYIYNSYPLLVDYLENNHPYRQKNNFYGSDYPLFCDRFGRAMKRQQVNELLQTTAKRGGIKIRVHNHLFRASCINHLKYNMGFSVEEIAYMVGHSNINTTYKSYLAINEGKILDRFANNKGTSDEEAEKKREEIKKQVASQYCFQCDKELHFTAKICPSCSTPMNIVENLQREKEKKAVALSEHKQLLKNYMRETFKELIEEEVNARTT